MTVHGLKLISDNVVLGMSVWAAEGRSSVSQLCSIAVTRLLDSTLKDLGVVVNR